MRQFLARLLAPAALVSAASAQVDYTLAFEPGGTLWEVEARFPGRGEQTLDFWIPLWTPGAYHNANFGQFVKELAAADEKGAELAVERQDKGHFVVSGAAKAKEIVLRYTAEPISSVQFAHGIIDVEANRIAADYAYVNPPSLFGFVPARAQEAVRLAVELPDGWKAATVLERDGQGRYLAPSYYRFEDSPFLFSPTLESATFTVDDKPHTVSVHGRSAEDTREIAAGCQRVVEAGSKLMQGLPYDRYHFLYGFVSGSGGSGLEHTYSTLILLDSAASHAEDSSSFWEITAHEFFHLWCAERIHVQEIHKPDLTEPIETGTIWVNEGITEYFCRHLLLHAGFLDEEGLLRTYVELQGVPGGSAKALQQMAGKASWTDVSRATVDWNGMGDVMTFALRMYMLGPRTIFALDMEMRRATKGERGVLDLLRYLMKEYVAKDRGFGEEELDDILLAVGGQPAADFLARYIDGDEYPDPAEYLGVIGYEYENGELRPVEKPTAEQEKARRDYFSVSGVP